MKGKEREISHLAIAIAGTRRNPKSLLVDRIATAESLMALLEIYGSTGQVAKKVQISKEMVREFLYLLRLSADALEYWRSGRIASVDMGYRISARVPMHLQARMAEAVVNGNLTSKDVDAITLFIREHPSVSPEDAVRRVMKSKDTVVYVAEYTLKPSIAKEYCRTGLSEDNLWRAVECDLKKMAGRKNVVDCRLQGRVLRIKINRDGLSRLRQAAKAAGVGLRDLASAIARRSLRLRETLHGGG